MGNGEKGAAENYDTEGNNRQVNSIYNHSPKGFIYNQKTSRLTLMQS